MIYIEGKLLNERTYQSTKARPDGSFFQAREVLIELENSFQPVLVQLAYDYDLKFKKGDIVKLPIRFSAWDDKYKKYTPYGVKISAIKDK